MQYWIVFYPGVGGDGFANLLEHADNVEPSDGVLKWRIHYATRPVKFYGAKWALINNENSPPFRHPNLNNNNLTLNPLYTDIVAADKNTIIVAHPIYWEHLDTFNYRDIIEKNQILIHLYSENYSRIYSDFVAKVDPSETYDVLTKKLTAHNLREFERKEYALRIDIDRAWNDWDYMSDCMNKLGINLDKKYYDEYLTYIDHVK